MVEADYGHEVALNTAKALAVYMKRPGAQPQLSEILITQSRQVPVLESLRCGSSSTCPRKSSPSSGSAFPQDNLTPRQHRQAGFPRGARLMQNRKHRASRVDHARDHALYLPWARIRSTSAWRTIMKIVVIGGTGLIGQKVVARLVAQGREAVAASPQTGVNALTGEGFADALAGAQVVVDVANSPSFEDNAVLNFFETSAAIWPQPRRRQASAITSRRPWLAPTGSRRAATSAPRWPRRR